MKKVALPLDGRALAEVIGRERAHLKPFVERRPPNTAR